MVLTKLALQEYCCSMCSVHLFKYMRVMTRATDVTRVLHVALQVVRLSTLSNGLDLGVNVMDSCCFAICLLSGCFSTNCIKQLVFSFF